MTAGTEPEGQVDAREVWRAVGRLEGRVDALQDDIREIKEALLEVNRRIDRMYYAMLGMGGALLAAIFASRFVEG